MQTAESSPCLPIRNLATSPQAITAVLNGLRMRTPSSLATSATRAKTAAMQVPTTSMRAVTTIPPPLAVGLSTCVKPRRATKAPKPTPVTSWLLVLHTVFPLAALMTLCIGAVNPCP